MHFVLTAAVNAAALWLASKIVPGIAFVTSASLHWVVVLLIAGALLAAVNALIKPVIKAISFPIYLLTLGLFSIVVNAAMLMLVSWITQQIGYGVTVDNFGTALVAGIIVSIATVILNAFLPRRLKKR